MSPVLALTLEGSIEVSPQELFREKVAEYSRCLTESELFCRLSRSSIKNRKKIWEDFKFQTTFYGPLKKKAIVDIEQTGIDVGFLPPKGWKYEKHFGRI